MFFKSIILVSGLLIVTFGLAVADVTSSDSTQTQPSNAASEKSPATAANPTPSPAPKKPGMAEYCREHTC